MVSDQPKGIVAVTDHAVVLLEREEARDLVNVDRYGIDRDALAARCLKLDALVVELKRRREVLLPLVLVCLLVKDLKLS